MRRSHKERLSARSQGNRIRKLLLSEYCELSETVLVESPFAETTRDGRGLRQVALGLTPSRLIVAADILRSNPSFVCPPGVDASIESFELVSVYPLEYVTLSVFSRRRRRTLKARFIDGRANYYELGGVRRRTSWRIWCEEVRKLLASKMDGSSLSETTAASSSSSSTLYLLSSEIEVKRTRDARSRRPMLRIWTRYGGAGDYIAPTWTEKDLYLGSTFNELMNGHYTPVPVRFAGASLEDLKYELGNHTSRYVRCERSCHSWPCQAMSGQGKSQRAGGLCNVLYARNYDNARRCDYTASCKSSPCNVCQLDDSVGIDILGQHSHCHERTEKAYEEPRTVVKSKVSRFGFGVPEKCRSQLILGLYRAGSSYNDVPEHVDRLAIEPHRIMEDGVRVWEDHCRSLRRQRHPRRYALASAAHFLYALGPWSVQPGERDSVQTLRSPSAVDIRKQPADPELRLPVSRRQLTSSVSCAALTPGGSSVVGTVTRGRVVLFWTPEYWYRPQAAVVAYRELRHHLESLQHFRHGKEKQTRRKFFCRRRNPISGENDVRETTIVGRSTSNLLERVLAMNGARKKNTKTNENVADVERGTAQLRRLLRVSLRITVWDLNSDILATQLTMIDGDLFVRIPATEIEVLIHQRSSRNAPNLGAWIAFSHRIACLTVSEILAIKQLAMRARIMARFINAADKCLALGNFQSCKSILAGLQAPPIYRLRRSWSYLRTHHAVRYEAMERLSKIYKNPCCPRYRKVWAATERNPPCMPYVGHFLVRVLGLNDPRPMPSDLAQSSTRKRSVARVAATSESPAVHKNPNDSRTADGQNFRGTKRCLARRILAATLTRIGLATRRDIAGDTTSDVWTRRQRFVARKYLDRWIAIALTPAIRAEVDHAGLTDAEVTRKRVLRVATWLTSCQRFAQGYSFPRNSFACEFLLKARYREDRDNFFISLKLEPPRTA